MAVHKVIRSNSLTQPPTQRTNAAAQSRHTQPEPEHRPDRQHKAEIFEALRRLNRGYGIALAAIDRLETKDPTPKTLPGSSRQTFSMTIATARRPCGPRPTATCSA